LHAPPEAALRIMVPILYRVSTKVIDNIQQPLAQYNNMYLECIPVEDLALHSDRILMLDNYTDFFVWSGHDVNQEQRKEYEQLCVQAAYNVAETRIPFPEIMVFVEGVSMARYLVARLIPSHNDTIFEQIKSFPEFKNWNKEQKVKFDSKFHRTDDLSYRQYLHSILQ